MLLAPYRRLHCCLRGISVGWHFVMAMAIAAPAFPQGPVAAPELIPAAEALPPAAELTPTEPVQLPAAHHDWGRCGVGAWRTMRITSESFDPTGESLGMNVTTETDTLHNVEDGHYSLETQSEVEVGGKTLHGPSRSRRLQLLTDTADENVQASQQPPAQFSLDGRTIPCSVWRVTVNRSDRQLVFELYYTAAVWPHVLRREIVESSTQEAAPPLSTTRVSVVRSQVPVMIDGRIIRGAHFHATTETASGRTERFEVHAEGVPGGLVSASTTEWDAEGRRTRWSSTELVEFKGEGPADRPLRRLLRRGRQR